MTGVVDSRPPLSLATVRRRMARNLALSEELAADREEIARRCPHDWRYHPDPSGNNDSHYTCTVCGKYARRKPE